MELAVNVYNAKVIAVCDTESSSDLIRNKGAYKTIIICDDGKKMKKKVADAVGDHRIKLVYDAVGRGLLLELADL